MRDGADRGERAPARRRPVAGSVPRRGVGTGARGGGDASLVGTPLARAHASDGTQSLLRQLLADRPAPRTPWEHVLRTRLARSLAQSPELSWSRPSRSWLANRGRTVGGRRLPWQPGISAARAVPRLCLLVDVSGSIETRVLERFASEMERLLRVHRAEIHLIVGDDRVREERLLQPGARALRELVVEGGGGYRLRAAARGGGPSPAPTS